MKRVLILIMALGLFAACKNKAKDVRNTGNTDNKTKDNYQDNNKDNTNNDNTRNTDYHSGGSWTSEQVREFVDNCVSEAEKGSLDHNQAQGYCTCMQKKLEKKYPNPNDAAGLTETDPEMEKMATDCLSGH